MCEAYNNQIRFPRPRFEEALPQHSGSQAGVQLGFHMHGHACAEQI